MSPWRGVFFFGGLCGFRIVPALVRVALALPALPLAPASVVALAIADHHHDQVGARVGVTMRAFLFVGL